jgi:hypothetical protein
MSELLSRDERPTYEELELRLKEKRTECHGLRNVVAVTDGFVQLSIRALEAGKTEEALEMLKRARARAKETKERVDGEQ